MQWNRERLCKTSDPVAGNRHEPSALLHWLNRSLVPRIAVTVGQRSASAVIFIAILYSRCIELGVILGSAGRMLRLERALG